MTEIWQAIAGYEGRYEVSSMGRVKSLARVAYRRSSPMRLRERILSQTIGSHGYPSVSLHRGDGQRTYTVHSLVARAFLGAPGNPRLEVCHADGDSLNARASNLTWGTHVENESHKFAHGTNTVALKTACPKGHAYTPENTYVDTKGARNCRTCSRLSKAAYKSRKKAAA